MSVTAKLFPFLMLAGLSACSPAPNGHASTAEESADPAAPSLAEAAPPVPVVEGERALTGRRAPILPAIDPDAIPRLAIPAVLPAASTTPPAPDAPQLAVLTKPLPTLPSVAAIPTPALAEPVVPDLPPSGDAADPPAFPEEVTRFMVSRDGCDHFRGEEAYDAERRAFLQDNIAELCTGTDARLASLRQLYARDPAVTAALSGYEDRIEGDGSQ